MYKLYSSIMTLLSTAGIVGNSLVIYIIMTRQGMRTVSNLLLVNLALADLLFVITWLAYSVLFISNVSYSVTYDSAYITRYISRLSLYVSVYTLSLIAVVRYLVVAHPHKSKRFVTRKNVGGLLAVVWVASFGFAIAKVSAFSVTYPCYLSALKFFTVFAYVLPLSVVATFSVLTFRRLKQPLGITAGSGGQNGNKKKAARLLAIIVVVFAVSWLPRHIDSIITSVLFCTNYDAPHHLWFALCSMFAEILALSNSCVNPIIYNLASTEFRQHFRDALCCRRQRRSATNRPIAFV